MEDRDDYAQDEDLMNDIQDAKETRKGKDLLAKNANDLHILVAAGGDPRPISLGMEYATFRALLNDQDADGMTPLMYAAEDLKGDIILQLKGTQVGLKNKAGQTALDLFNEALNRDPEVMPVPEYADYIARLRRELGAENGGRRRKTRMRKSRRRMTRRRR